MSSGGSSGSSGGGSGSGVTTNYVRYPPYLEALHKDLVLDVAWQSTYTSHNDRNPFYFDVLEMNDVFFESGKTITSYDSLYKRYDDLILQISADEQFDLTFNKTINVTPKALIAEEARLMDQDLEQRLLPKLYTGARDINSVNSTTFVLAKGNLITERHRALFKFSNELKYKMIPVAVERWKANNAWRAGALSMFAEITKMYLTADLDFVDQKATYLAKRRLWPFTMFDHRRASIGGPTDSSGTSSYVAGESGASSGAKALSGAVGGAALGSQIMPGWGTAIGGVVGGIAGFLS